MVSKCTKFLCLCSGVLYGRKWTFHSNVVVIFLKPFRRQQLCPIHVLTFYYLPDVSWLCFQVIPALVHVIKPVLEQGSFLRVSQGFHHLLSVSINAFEDVIVGINLSLDVLKYQQQKSKHLSSLNKGRESLFSLVLLSTRTEHIVWLSWVTQRDAEGKTCNPINIIIKGLAFFSVRNGVWKSSLTVKQDLEL